MLNGIERKNLFMIMKNSPMMKHFSVECCLFGDESHEVPKVNIGDILDLEMNLQSWELCSTRDEAFIGQVVIFPFIL